MPGTDEDLALSDRKPQSHPSATDGFCHRTLPAEKLPNFGATKLLHLLEMVFHRSDRELSITGALNAGSSLRLLSCNAQD
eukprot:2154229-Rhodomonas_salina.4